jgi:integrase
MASLELDPTSGRFRVRFRYGGIPFKRSLKTGDRREAESVVGRIEETIRLLERGRLEMPAHADPGAFILSDGKLLSRIVAPSIRTLGDLFRAYRDNLPAGAKEESTIKAEDRHIRHLIRHLHGTCIAQGLTVRQMQEYVEKRGRDKWRKNCIGPDTIKKELTTFRFIWNWGVRHGHLTGPAPIRGISLPKTDEEPPFMTWEELSGIMARSDCTDSEMRPIWECLFLRTGEIEELLEHVRIAALHTFIHPMFAFVAHTGARRSEILRSEITDFDFASATVLLREKKKSRKKAITFRRVPMTALLRTVMKQWFGDRPSGALTFPQSVLPNSTEAAARNAAITGDQAAHHFETTLAGSKWAKVRGFHVFRHSFASNCAAAGVDQRIIDEWMGHQTDEMRRRYRHLFPEQQRAAIESVFGGYRQ